MAGMASSSSAPALSQSPYAVTLSKSGSRKSSKWLPPPGAFNKPDLPLFSGPGPGRYTPSTSYTKPRQGITRFGSEDRLKYLGPQNPMETTSTGMAGMYCPQAAASPGPGYMPKYDLVHSASRKSAFTVERRDTSGVGPGSGASVAPGPGLYNPSDRSISTRKNFTGGGAFLADDRHKYLGQVDPVSGCLMKSDKSPGPAYDVDAGYRLTTKSSGGVSFGGRGPGSLKKPPSLKAESPGPGTYTPMTQGACLSSKRRVQSTVFGVETRNDKPQVDSVHMFHGGKVPVDMSHASQQLLHNSPGPSYNPSYKVVQRSSQKAVIGTARRFMQTA